MLYGAPDGREDAQRFVLCQTTLAGDQGYHGVPQLWAATFRGFPPTGQPTLVSQGWQEGDKEYSRAEHGL